MKKGGNKIFSLGVEPTVLSTIDGGLYNFNIKPNLRNFFFPVNKKFRDTFSHFFYSWSNLVWF